MEDLPDEVILRVFSNLKTKNLIQCGQVSKRIRTISCDISLWQKLDFSDMKLSTQLVKMILSRGCMDLDLNSAELNGNLSVCEYIMEQVTDKNQRNRLAIK